MTAERGKFIVFEGVDWSGKSTQAFLLTRYLGERKLRVLATREPGGTPIGEQIREILLDPAGEDLSTKCELLLYLASRAQHVNRVISPTIENGVIVVSERYNWSTLAYQAYAGGLPLETVEEIAGFATGRLAPDLTILLDLDPEVAAMRALAPGGRGHDRIERKGIPFQRKVREGFMELARRHTEKSRIVDATRPAKQIHEEVKALVDDVL